MAIRRDLTGDDALREANDEDLDVVLTTNKPTPGTVLNLTGKTLEAFLKPAAATADNDPGAWKGTTAGGEITVTDAAGGKASIAIPAAAVVTAKGWWRVDVLDGGKRKTALYGTVAVTDL